RVWRLDDDDVAGVDVASLVGLGVRAVTECRHDLESIEAGSGLVAHRLPPPSQARATAVRRRYRPGTVDGDDESGDIVGGVARQGTIDEGTGEVACGI